MVKKKKKKIELREVRHYTVEYSQTQSDYSGCYIKGQYPLRKLHKCMMTIGKGWKGKALQIAKYKE